MIILIATGVTLLIACAVVAVIAATHGAPSGGAHGSGARTIGIYPSGRLCPGRVACSRLFSDSARLYTSARWAVVKVLDQLVALLGEVDADHARVLVVLLAADEPGCLRAAD